MSVKRLPCESRLGYQDTAYAVIVARWCRRKWEHDNATARQFMKRLASVTHVRGFAYVLPRGGTTKDLDILRLAWFDASTIATLDYMMLYDPFSFDPDMWSKATLKQR